MNVGMMKLWTPALLVTAVAGLVLSSGCGGGGGSTTDPIHPPDPVAYTVLGANDVPKTNTGDNDPDYPVKDGVLYTRKDGNGNQIPVSIAFNCNAPAPRQMDVVANGGVGTKEYFLLNKAENDSIDPQTGRITIKTDKCTPGETDPSISVKTYSNGTSAKSAPVMYKRLNF